MYYSYGVAEVKVLSCCYCLCMRMCVCVRFANLRICKLCHKYASDCVNVALYYVVAIIVVIIIVVAIVIIVVVRFGCSCCMPLQNEGSR